MKLLTFALSAGIKLTSCQLLTSPFIDLPTEIEVATGHVKEKPFLGVDLHITSTDSALCDPDVVQYTGFGEIKGTNKRYFFWFFESRESPGTSPTVAWLTGGPGCSSLLALFGENGPCSVNKDGESTRLNPHSWTSNANMLWIDQPPGTGFSEGDADSGEKEVAEDMLGFLVALVEAFPQYNKDFYIFGESYAGHYIPAIASRVHAYNKQAGGAVIDLKGIGIGNGLTAPSEQYKWYPEMAFKSGTAPSAVSEETYEGMQKSVDTCVNTIELCNRFEGTNPFCFAAIAVCNLSLMKPYQDTGLNPYDMRLKCEKPPLCYDFSEIDAFLNRPEIQNKIGVSKLWQSCDMTVNLHFVFDFMRDYDALLPELLGDGIRVLIYAGDQDFICNWIGNKHWVLNLDWSGKAGFNAAQDVAYKTPSGQEIGLMRSFENLQFLQVFEAGHMVPMDQPGKSLVMFNDFIYPKNDNADSQLVNVMVE